MVGTNFPPSILMQSLFWKTFNVRLLIGWEIITLTDPETSACSLNGTVLFSHSTELIIDKNTKSQLNKRKPWKADVQGLMYVVSASLLYIIVAKPWWQQFPTFQSTFIQ